MIHFNLFVKEIHFQLAYCLWRRTKNQQTITFSCVESNKKKKNKSGFWDEGRPISRCGRRADDVPLQPPPPPPFHTFRQQSMAIFQRKFERLLTVDDTESLAATIESSQTVDGHTVSPYEYQLSMLYLNFGDSSAPPNGRNAPTDGWAKSIIWFDAMIHNINI